jgi:hypothetical protein
MPAAEVRALAGYLGPRTAGARYEVATAYYPTVGRLIARDGRPVMILTSVKHIPVVSTRRLARAVRHGDVRYILIDGACGRRPLSKMGHCPAAVGWARKHSVDVSKEAGLRQASLLFRFTQRP